MGDKKGTGIGPMVSEVSEGDDTDDTGEEGSDGGTGTLLTTITPRTISATVLMGTIRDAAVGMLMVCLVCSAKGESALTLELTSAVTGKSSMFPGTSSLNMS